MSSGPSVVAQSSMSGSGDEGGAHPTMVRTDEALCGEVPSIFIEDALSRLRDLPDDFERYKELKNMVTWKAS